MASLKLVVAALVLVMAVSVNSEQLGHFLTRRAVLLDENFAPVAAARPLFLQRQRRDSGYAPPIHHKPYKGGKVGPVYTFVKTDTHGNFKWGVRHRAGSKYAGHH
ncbi:hypothetical protein SK128_018787 [Halocaridina rubra]|uniref:Uncharacterized protein n=1 Tax=Halocaridina rubra TaxID=373956 RepID=A0AAN8WYR9_HALRR